VQSGWRVAGNVCQHVSSQTGQAQAVHEGMLRTVGAAVVDLLVYLVALLHTSNKCHDLSVTVASVHTNKWHGSSHAYVVADHWSALGGLWVCKRLGVGWNLCNKGCDTTVFGKVHTLACA